MLEDQQSYVRQTLVKTLKTRTMKIFKAVSHSNENVIVERRTAYADAMKAQLNSGVEVV